MNRKPGWEREVPSGLTIKDSEHGKLTEVAGTGGGGIGSTRERSVYSTAYTISVIQEARAYWSVT